MAEIVAAKAFANNEVAFLAWSIAPDPSPGCLGFHIVREYLDDSGNLLNERPLASYIAFKGQRNPNWQAQNTTVWPVQKFTWRDLTLRKKRNAAERRPENEKVRYRIRGVGDFAPGLEPVVVVPESHKDRNTGETVQHAYEGTPRPLGYVTAAAHTNVIDVTSSRPPFRTTFTNGILSTQFLRNVLSEDGTIENGELERHLKAEGDWLRNYLSGDVLVLMRDFFEMQQGGRFKAALYELEDEELVALLERHAERIDLILSDAGSSTSEDDDEPGSKTTLYDTHNQAARARLRAIAERPGTGFTLQDRMFNGSGHIGHNKFVVHLADGARGTSVLTGSTNWTWTGVAGQSNNCAVIDDGAVADGYLAYWNRLRDDNQPTPEPLSTRAVGAGQHDALKKGNEVPVPAPLAGNGAMTVWYSPNMPGKTQPPTSKTRPVPPPPDMENLFSLMRKVQRAIFFLVFMPSRGGVHSIVSEAISLGLKDTALNVVGAISDTQAMWGFEPSSKTASGKKLPAWSPHVFKEAGVSVVRATALTDREIQRSLGDFKTDETLTLGRAIIHDKILVIDPHDPQACVVAFGSHNLGYKASYSNDENLVIVRGHQPLALAYTAHILDVYDHYRFRAVEAELAAAKAGRRANASAEDSGWDGFLATNDAWQAKASRRLAAYFTGGV